MADKDLPTVIPSRVSFVLLSVNVFSAIEFVLFVNSSNNFSFRLFTVYLGTVDWHSEILYFD